MNDTSIGDWEVLEAQDKDLLKTKGKAKESTAWPYETPSEEKLEPATNIIKEVIDALDRDVSGPDAMNSIDFNTELNVMEVPAMTTLQMLSSLGLGGDQASVLARRIQRNKVSIGRKGRTEKVDIIKGEREHETNTGGENLFGKIKGFMGKKNDKNTA